jgi:hypothetical protein
MKTKISLKLLLAINCLLLQFNLFAQDAPPITLHVEPAGTLGSLIPENKRYQITDLTLTGYLNGDDIRIIRTMAINQKLTILNLADANIGGDGSGYTPTNIITAEMFRGAKLTNISLPNNITEIREFAFVGCSGLTGITIPNSVTLIGWGAFQYCTGLTNVTIGNSVTSIDSEAFDHCTGLTGITIPNSVTLIEWGAFQYCTGLKEFIVSEQNSNYSTINGVLFDKNKTTLLVYPNAKGTSYTIPNSVTSIRYRAFSYCSGLTDVIIPNSVTSIEANAFFYCTGLTDITIPGSVTLIEHEVFFGCTGLTSVTIPNSVTSIGVGAFGGCSGLTSVTIPSSVTSIEYGVLTGCTGLNEIHNHNPVPLPLSQNFSNYFHNVNKTTCKLYVPKGSYVAYWLAPVWGDFVNIIEEDVVAINPIKEQENVSIQPVSNGISIEAKEKTPVAVYTVSGQKVYQSIIQNNTEIRLDKGVYIVKINTGNKKIIVK